MNRYKAEEQYMFILNKHKKINNVIARFEIFETIILVFVYRQHHYYVYVNPRLIPVFL